MAPYGPRDVTAQWQAVLDDTVRVAEKLDDVDADDRGALALLLLAQRAAFSGSMPSMPASPLVTKQ